MSRDGRGPVAVEAAAAHFPGPGRTRLVVIPGTGHTYRGKERETARAVAELVARWRREARGG